MRKIGKFIFAALMLLCFCCISCDSDVSNQGTFDITNNSSTDHTFQIAYFNPTTRSGNPVKDYLIPAKSTVTIDFVGEKTSGDWGYYLFYLRESGYWGGFELDWISTRSPSIGINDDFLYVNDGITCSGGKVCS